MKKLMYHLEYILILPIVVICFLLANNNIILYSLAATFLLQALAYILLLTNKYKLKAISGIIVFINGALATVILLLFAIFETQAKTPMYFLIYLIFYMLFKIASIIYYNYNKNDFKCIIYKEYAIILLMFIINLIVCILLHSYSIDSQDYLAIISYKSFVNDSISYDKFRLTLIIIKILINFISSNFIAYYSASSLILLLKNKPLTLKGKIKAIIEFINKYYISFILGEVFTSIISISYFLQYEKGNNYVVLGYFFLMLLVLRTFVFIWDKISKKKYINDPYMIYKSNFILLIIVSSIFIVSNQSLNTVLLSITDLKNDPNAMPLWWLILIMLPFTSYSFVNSIITYHRAKINDDASLLASSNLSAITSLYSFFGASIYFLAKFENIAVIGWLILITGVISSELYVSIKSLIIGIKGVSGNRKKREDFILDMENEIKEELVEEEKLIKEIDGDGCF